MPPLPRSLPRICVALGFPTPGQLSRAAETEYKDGSTFLEFRLDYLADPQAGLRVLRTFREHYPDAHVLATCRHRQNQGRFEGTVECQAAILRDAAAAGATALDFEIESAERAGAAALSLREAAPLVVSYHNFENTPVLLPIVRRLSRIPCDAYKIATTARKPSDSLRILDFVRNYRGTPLIAFAMSEAGAASRILCVPFGGLFSYAAPAGGGGTAPGQMPAKSMRSLYRFEKLGKQSRVYGVIADPVGHSKSPVIHNRAFQSRRIDAVYLPFLVPASCLNDWMKVAVALPVSGFSVTIPHKQRIVRYLDAVDPIAKRVGAVNTVWRKSGKWRGANTDTEGVVLPLARRLRLPHASVLIAGYGGAARAAAIALSDAGASLTITGRNLARASALAKVVNAEAVSLATAQKSRYDALVHATPVGMAPKPQESLFPDAVPAGVVFDMVYNPHETRLLRSAREQNCTLIYGSEMLLEQAARQFEIWTGESAPRSVMQKALEQHAV